LIAIGYAWSQKSVSYFISTCGSTNPASHSYETHFEDEFGVIQTKYIARPHLLEWVYNYLPLIDEHPVTFGKEVANKEVLVPTSGDTVGNVCG
jgi:hypothetical protein